MTHVFEDRDGAPWPEEVQREAALVGENWSDEVHADPIEYIGDLIAAVEKAVRDHHGNVFHDASMTKAGLTEDGRAVLNYISKELS